MTHSTIGSQIVSTSTLCRLLGCTERQLRDAERAGIIGRISEPKWLEILTERMQQEAAATPEYQGRTKRLNDAELVALASQTIAHMQAEEDAMLTREVSAAELAEVLHVTPRWLHQLAQDGILPRTEGGRFPFAHALACYLNFKRDGRGQ